MVSDYLHYNYVGTAITSKYRKDMKNLMKSIYPYVHDYVRQYELGMETNAENIMNLCLWFYTKKRDIFITDLFF